MGYSTYFNGSFKLSRKLTVSEIDTLFSLSEGEVPDDLDDTLTPGDQCHWIPIEVLEDGRHKHLERGDPRSPLQCLLVSPNEEKMYDWDEWLSYLSGTLFKAWGVEMGGKMVWQGEDTGDSGVIFAKGNKVKFVSIDELARFMEDACGDDLYED